MYFFGYDISGPPWLRYHVADASGHLVRTEPITIGGPAMVHDFALTEHHVVWFDLPVVYDFDLLGRRPFPATWKPEYGARVGVMPRAGGDTDVRWTEIDPCYVYHPANAWDDGDRVVVDVPKYGKVFDLDLSGPVDTGSVYERWTIDPSGGKVGTEVLDGRGQEFPRINERLLGRQHRYAYATRTEFEGAVAFNGLVKHDHERQTSEAATFGTRGHAGEPIFVADPDGTNEDDGWVLAVVYDASRDGSDLYVLDATDFSGRPAAKIALPQRVPFGFHGSWIPDSALT
jgi:carotenoid cleavage dioxygenase